MPITKQTYNVTYIPAMTEHTAQALINVEGGEVGEHDPSETRVIPHPCRHLIF